MNNELLKKLIYPIYGVLLVIINFISFSYSDSVNNLKVSIHKLFYAYSIEITNELNSTSFKILFILILAIIFYLLVRYIRINIIKWVIVIVSVLLSIPILDLSGQGSNVL